MQLHTTADGQEHEMSLVSYPPWSAPTSHEHRADPYADGKNTQWWPSQAYHCTYCPRYFRTAQALGGHMNIHRRERAFANEAFLNDTATHFQTRRGDSQASNSILSTSSSHPAAPLDQVRSSLFSSTPPTPCPASCKYDSYANRRTAVTPDSATHRVTTTNFFAPLQAADMTYHRSGWNRGDAAKLGESSRHNISDPLSWLFSQLPPPGSVSTLQRQQSQPQQNQHQQQFRGGNILMQKNLAKPYHRAVAVRRSVGHLSPPFSAQTSQARGRLEAGGSRNGGQGDGVEELDLELRL